MVGVLQVAAVSGGEGVEMKVQKFCNLVAFATTIGDDGASWGHLKRDRPGVGWFMDLREEVKKSLAWCVITNEVELLFVGDDFACVHGIKDPFHTACCVQV